MTVLLDMVHGSHLYGLATANSDLDRFVVLDEAPSGTKRARWAKQTIRDGVDTLCVDLGTFGRYSMMGSHQYVEAMMAPSEACDVDLLKEYRSQFRVAGFEYRRKYVGAIRNFAGLDEWKDGPTLKSRRHAIRLAWCLRELEATGRCTVRLSQDKIDQINVEANLPDEEFVGNLLSIHPWIDVPVKEISE